MIWSTLSILSFFTWLYGEVSVCRHSNSGTSWCTVMPICPPTRSTLWGAEGPRFCHCRVSLSNPLSCHRNRRVNYLSMPAGLDIEQHRLVGGVKNSKPCVRLQPVNFAVSENGHVIHIFFQWHVVSKLARSIVHNQEGIASKWCLAIASSRA